MNMLFDNIVVTDIQPPVVVHSVKGKNMEMTNRPQWGLSLCRSGQITYTMDGKQYVSTEGAAVLLPQGSCYSLSRDQSGFFPLINFSCAHLAWDRIHVFPLENPEACLKQFDRMKSLSLSGENRLKLFSAFYQLLDTIGGPATNKNDLLFPAIACIEENLADPTLNNTQLAKQAGISEVYLRKLFLTHYSITPKQYILEARIQRAKQLLSDPGYSVAQVVEQCGFSCVYHFCRTFRQRCGCTPGSYARENQIHLI